MTSDKVETAAVQLATKELSHALGTEVRVGAVEYRFPARLAIKDVYLEDRQGDTLAYVGLLYAHFSPLALHRGEIKFSHVRLEDVVADVHQLPDSTWNYAFLLPLFQSDKPKDDSPFRSVVKVKDVQLSNLRLRYNDLEARIPKASMDLHELSAERLDAQIKDFQAEVTRYADKRVKPLTVESLKAHLIVTDSLLAFQTLTAQLPNSHLDLSGIEVKMSSKEKKDALVAMTMDAELMPSDIELFVPRLAKFKRKIEMRGHLSGTVDSLYFDNISVRYNKREVLRGEVSAVGLPDFSNPYLRANLQDFQTNAAQLQDFLSQLYGRPVKLPAQVHRLGTIHYRGLAEGRLHDLTLHGAFRTALGTISTDGSFRSDSLFRHMAYDARVVGRRFRLGRLMNHPQLNSMTLDITAKGEINEGAGNGDISAYVRELTYDGYTYNDLKIKGYVAPKHYHGTFDINDPHCNMAFDGVVDLRDQNPEINFNLLCRHFDSEPITSGRSKLQTSFA
ncbi:MAG: hypothetical protein J5704_00590, partial [Paludibacteraceae bacterium]|nr:hypothetical protein [Paludibacteraceae bacterium]